jgi:hypothetical protein
VETTVKIIRRIEDRVAKDKYVNVAELNNILREEISGLLLENPHAGTQNIDKTKKALCNNGGRCKWRWKNNNDWKTCSSV